MTEHMSPGPDRSDETSTPVVPDDSLAQVELADAVDSSSALEGSPAAGSPPGVETSIESTGEAVEAQVVVSEPAPGHSESLTEEAAQHDTAPDKADDADDADDAVGAGPSTETPSDRQPPDAEANPEAQARMVDTGPSDVESPQPDAAPETISANGDAHAVVASETGAPVEASLEVAAGEPAQPEAPPVPVEATLEVAAGEPAQPEAPPAPVEATLEMAAGEPAQPEAPSGPERPAAPSPGVPKPSALPRRPAPTPASLATAGGPGGPGVVTPPVITTDHSASAAFGRVDDEGVVYVRTADGEDRQVGSYPGAAPDQALTYFARKYDELFASTGLLEARLQQPEVASKDVQDALKTLTAQVRDAAVVGDLDALAAKLDAIRSGIAAKRLVEQQHRALARTEAKAEREAIVAEAESIAGQPENRIQWKTSGARMRELLDGWKAHQRASIRLDRESETALWQRFSAARNRFDKARRTHFAGLDAAHSDAKSVKESLVTQAEKLATSKDWAATASAFKRLMDDWRSAGRASRTDDDRLWARFKAAQDTFFAAKDAVVAAEEEGFRGNLSVKEALLEEATAILPVTDLEKAKSQLRGVQDRWDAAGKVPRADLERVEKAMRRVEQTVRDAEEKRWKSSNPEAAARASAMAEQLERAVSGLEAELATAQQSGDTKKIAQAQAALEARQAWLSQARAGVAEFGG